MVVVKEAMVVKVALAVKEALVVNATLTSHDLVGGVEERHGTVYEYEKVQC